MFRLVADVETYPEFLPWCVAARIHSREEREMAEIVVADLMVSFKGIREKFTSEVTSHPRSNRIEVEYIRGPFEHMVNQWEFHRNLDGTCTVDFHIEFHFRSRLLRMMVGVLFDHVVETMVEAFEQRAEVVYPKIAPQRLLLP